MQQLGTVIIGRNEGERLRRCVRSVLSHCAVVVYVDSGSEDDSVEFCTQQGVDIIELDPGIPFSAARARNEGMQLLNQKYPELSYIQFVDGDCEVFDQWFDQALTHLAENKSLAIVCGRRKERHPDQSVYNRLCDIEWNTPVGIADACGGDFLARVEALKAVAGFNPEVVAGEEPEMCYRLRAKGWEIERIDAEMTKHDAMITRFSQWWRRTLRSGHAYAHTMILHWGEKERLNVRSVMSIMVWGLGVPVIFLAALLLGLPLLTVSIVLVYLVMILKIARYLEIERAYSRDDSRIYGFYTMLGKTPQAFGVLQFFVKRLGSSEFEIIEYKN